MTARHVKSIPVSVANRQASRKGKQRSKIGERIEKRKKNRKGIHYSMLFSHDWQSETKTRTFVSNSQFVLFSIFLFSVPFIDEPGRLYSNLDSGFLATRNDYVPAKRDRDKYTQSTAITATQLQHETTERKVSKQNDLSSAYLCHLIFGRVWRRAGGARARKRPVIK